ncbi:MAG: SUMF1/EgtB/PvdO family nonheme iron enzyme [Phycisphaerales bacterium]|nr:MAG: SUMF1/EgtB/PvdO family nonheme iron enzyme [Phycisphaerales bacterium]
MNRAVIACKALLAGYSLLALSPTLASVEFDGLAWHLSRNPSRLILDDQGRLVWMSPGAPDQVTVQLPPMDLTKVGAIARVSYLYKGEGVITGVPATDPTLLSGTGDIRVGLFDSNGQGHINQDDTGYRNEIWRGYLGYHARICPHLPVGITRLHSDAIPGKFMKRTGAMEEESDSLLQNAALYGKSKDLSGFGLGLGCPSILALQVKRAAPETLAFTITLNDVSYTYVDDDPQLQPKKIDTLAMYFPNPKAFSSITFAGDSFSTYGAGTDRRQEKPATKAVGDPVPSTTIEFVSISPGTFTMGADLPPDYITAERGVFIQDEFPVRRVAITHGFQISKHEITNIQYEKYDPDHAAWRGRAPGVSTRESDAVVYVDWNEAIGFCQWLSSRDVRHDYRLPTEAEWEYVCRAGTKTPFSDGIDGDVYSMNPLGSLAGRWQIITDWFITRGNANTEKIAHRSPEAVDLAVRQQGPNPWGMFNMHGGVEEWTQDWYGPYVRTDRKNPVGYTGGIAKVVRGGSHNVHLQTLRSANRSAALPTDKHFLLGFRVVRVPKGQTLPDATLRQRTKAWAKNVTQRIYSWPSDSGEPFFQGPVSFYKVNTTYNTPELAAQFGVPLYTHNHSPAITWAANGDLLVAWFSGESEKGQELTILGLRGRRQSDGSLAWDSEISEFFKIADRNMHGVQLWNNSIRLAHGFKEPFTLYHINGICTDGKWSKLAMSFRKSIDNGATWTQPVIMKQDSDALHLDSDRNQPQGDVTVTSDGAFLSFSDGSAVGGSGSSSNYSRDGGETWYVRGMHGPPGIHVGSVELNDGRILAFSRDKGETFGTLPKSLSPDQGQTWSFSKTQFPPIGTVQRLALLRLEYSQPLQNSIASSGTPILLISIATNGIKGMDANGHETLIYGTYAALSWDEGETWPVTRVLSDVRNGSQTHIMAPWNTSFILDATHGQPKSYWAATQTPDGVVHLSDGRLYYAFNLAWLSQAL